jgi:hypothetical protein
MGYPPLEGYPAEAAGGAVMGYPPGVAVGIGYPIGVPVAVGGATMGYPAGVDAGYPDWYPTDTAVTVRAAWYPGPTMTAATGGD